MSARGIAAAVALALAGLDAGCRSQPRLIAESAAALLPTDAGSAAPRGLPPAMIAPPAATDAAPGEVVAPVEEPRLRPAKVKIGIRSSPKAVVSWGKRVMGVTPLTFERPRDSGPMDLVLRAKGYLPLHSRAYTFRNEGLQFTLTRTEESGKLLGAKKAVDKLVAPKTAAAPTTDAGAGATPTAIGTGTAATGAPAGGDGGVR